MTFLVTGGLGLIGHNIVARLQAYESVVVVDNQTTYGIIPQAELDYLMTERRKKIGEDVPICLVGLHVETLALGVTGRMPVPQGRPSCLRPTLG